MKRVPYIIVALSDTGALPQAHAAAVSTEWDAHAVASLIRALGHRAFFIDAAGQPLIEEYRRLVPEGDQ